MVIRLLMLFILTVLVSLDMISVSVLVFDEVSTMLFSATLLLIVGG